MPKALEEKAKKRGGVIRYRMKKVGDTLFRCMVTKKLGPKGGKTLCYKVKTKPKRY